MRIHRIALSGLVSCLLLSGLALTGTGCAGDRYQRSTGTYVDDKALAAKVKTALFKDPVVSGFDVNVNTYRGEVQLSGFVDTPEQKERAAAIAREIPGVQMVVNNLQLKPAPEEAVGSSGAAVQGSSRTEIQPAPERPAADIDRNARPDVPRDPDLDRDRAPAGRLESKSPTSATDSPALAHRPGARDLEIDIEHGIATIKGSVASETEKRDLERRISEIPGVERVESKLEVRPPAPVRE